MAIKTTKTLRLSFRRSEGKSTSMILANAADNLPADKVKDAMKKISGANVFEKDGVAIYAEPTAANYIERTVTPVFDDSEAEVKDAE